VFFAQTLHPRPRARGLDEPRSRRWSTTGCVCQGGSPVLHCNDNRDLFDDFRRRRQPVTGMASIAYGDDAYSDNTGSSPLRTNAATRAEQHLGLHNNRLRHPDQRPRYHL